MWEMVHQYFEKDKRHDGWVEGEAVGILNAQRQ